MTKCCRYSGPASHTKAFFVKAAPTERCKLKHLKNNSFQAYITNYPTKLSFTISAITTKPFTMTLISCSTEQHDIAETFTPTASYFKKSTADPADAWAPVGQDLSPEASMNWGKSPEVSALDPANAELNSTLPGTHTQQESRTRLWNPARGWTKPLISTSWGYPQLTQPESFQSHGMIKGGQIIPPRKEFWAPCPCLDLSPPQGHHVRTP